MSFKLYVEGGGDRAELRTACRRAFTKFIEKAGAAGRMPRIVACGSRQNAYDSFKTAHVEEGAGAMLLVDAEAPVTSQGPWQHLNARDGWERPDAATDEQCHLMVQVMESWFLADRDALASFYGNGFRRASLPQNSNIEQVSKQDIFDGLRHATRDVKKGRRGNLVSIRSAPTPWTPCPTVTTSSSFSRLRPPAWSTAPAWPRMLGRQGIITQEDAGAIVSGLDRAVGLARVRFARPGRPGSRARASCRRSATRTSRRSPGARLAACSAR